MYGYLSDTHVDICNKHKHDFAIYPVSLKSTLPEQASNSKDVYYESIYIYFELFTTYQNAPEVPILWYDPQNWVHFIFNLGITLQYSDFLELFQNLGLNLQLH